jgi:hypothetical protein
MTDFRLDAKGTGNTMIPYCDYYPGDRSNITITGSALSSFMNTWTATIASNALFFKTAADAERYWQKTAASKYVQCLAEYITGDYVKGTRTRTLGAKQIPIGPTGASRAVAYRTVTSIQRPGGQEYYRTETVAFVMTGRSVAIIRIMYVNRLCECHTGLARLTTARLRDANNR